jgi:hypothetical protein
MYKFLFIILLTSCFFSCDIRGKKTKSEANPEPESQVLKDSTTIQMIDSVYNFGKVTDGEKVEYSFRFKNTGVKPLIIKRAQPSCGCTVAEKPEQPVMPGETSYIKTIFNSAGRVGDVHKEIVISSNAKPYFPTLKLIGVVESKNNN